MGPTPFSVGYDQKGTARSPGSGASMGPTPFSVGYTSVRADPRAVHGGFNGANAFQRWIRDGSRRRPARLPCFNGANAFQRWIPGIDSEDAMCCHRFNGANAFQRWIRESARGELPNRPRFNGANAFQRWIPDLRFVIVPRIYRVRASMGPTPFSVGYDATPASPFIERAASMGPTPFSVGYSVALRAMRYSPMCFNGANAFQRWIRLLRIHMAACSKKLQWGQRLSALDTFTIAPHASHGVGASMGPTPFSVGYGTERWSRRR